MKTTLIASLLLLASLAAVPGASAVDPCDAYGACYSVGSNGVFVGDCQQLTCAGVGTYGDETCLIISEMVPQCVRTD